MPAKSAKQYRFMQMMVHSPEKKKTGEKGIGPSPDVAKEFVEKTPQKKRKEFSRRFK